MRSELIAVVLLLVMVLVSCQAAVIPPPRQTAAAGSIDEVIEAWDIHCASHGFAEYDSLGGTMGDHYSQANFAVDAAAFMQSIQNEVQSSLVPKPGEDELVVEVVSAPEWFL